MANRSSGNPVHNTFSYEISLSAWGKKTSWDYLVSRLSGVGVVLPLRYREELLSISRGIPWIIVDFGLKICQLLPAGEKVVYPQTWYKAKTKVLTNIEENLKVSVTRLANKLDLAYGKQDDTQAQLGNGQLWHAFTTLASEVRISFDSQVDTWQEPGQFSREQLQALLPGVDLAILRETLRQLSSSPVMEGIVAEEERFVFANNLLPAWLYHRQGL